jgi:hypothetical protein
LDANGNPLSDSATSWAMVKDNFTGLVWENKTNDGSIHDTGKTYTWADAQNVFIAQLNAANFGGHNDWRMPTHQELRSIADYSRYNPAINTGYFPNTQSVYTNLISYWSSSTYAGDANRAWFVNFYWGSDYDDQHGNKSDSLYVRAVRGSGGSFRNFTNNGNGTVTDAGTGLIWQQATGNNGAGMIWKDALAYCENLTLAGYTDWRLPNITELASLVDESRYNPAINTDYFPDTKSEAYSSSTSNPFLPDSPNVVTWLAWFTGGHIGHYYKFMNNYVRCVRGGIRIIAMQTSLDFNDVQVGTTKSLTLIISNTGNSPLTVSSIDYPAGFSGNWSGQIPAGGSQNVTVMFSPTAGQSYSGTVTVNSDKTSGTNTVAISGTVVGVSTAYKLPDTGQTKCYNDTVEIACPSPGQDFYGQDGNYTINPPSYTKLDANGNALPDSATTWAMVKDNVTGLIWESKTTDGSIHDANKTYTWADAQNVFIPQLNAANFGGHNDWRLPTQQELRSIADYSRYKPAINTGYFLNTQNSQYWSSSADAYSTSLAWLVYFDDGSDSYGDKSISYYVRAVRGGSGGLSSNFVINNDGTVTDKSTGLMWQQATGNNSETMTWKAALVYCDNLSLAGYTDWRLPNVRELVSLADLSRYSPAINTGYFPDTKIDIYWPSSTYVNPANYNQNAWTVFFGYGYDNFNNKSDSYYVRCVRGGQSLLPTPTITAITPTTGTTAGGTTVTITGTNFVAGSTSVSFGGSAATVSSVSATQIICTTPAHAAGAVDVAVTVAGLSATKAGGFTYTVPITRVIVLSGNLAFGNVIVGTTKQLTFTISNTGNSPLTVSSITYPTGFSDTLSKPITIPPGGSQPVPVTFAPTAVQNYSGTVTVNSDKTDGMNMMPISGNGIETVPFVARTLPDCYTAGTKLTVTLKAAPPTGTLNYMIEDSPPAGWTVSNISSPGTYDSINNKVKFIFYDGSAQTFTYDVTPPQSETGDKNFAGSALKDSSLRSPITGQAVISRCSPYHPADISPADFRLTMEEVSAYITAWQKGYLWNGVRISGSYVSRAGGIWQNGEFYKYDPAAGSPPMCWVNTAATRSVRDNASSVIRKMPAYYVTGKAVTVLLDVTVGNSGLFYTIEETPPDGWTVSDVSSPGSFDETNKIVTFYGNQTKTWSYKLTPPAGTTGIKTFTAKSWFNGAEVAVTGISSVSDAKPAMGDVNGSGGEPDLADAIVALQVVAGLNPPNVFASADVNNDNKIGLEEVIYILQKLSGLR